jgi:hypothetical protein
MNPLSSYGAVAVQHLAPTIPEAVGVRDCLLASPSARSGMSVRLGRRFLRDNILHKDLKTPCCANRRRSSVDTGTPGTTPSGALQELMYVPSPRLRWT